MEINEQSIIEVSKKIRRCEEEISKGIIGQKDTIRNVLIAIFAEGNVLLEGMPGMGKTQLVKTIGKVLDLKFSRIQFTPDLMPADVVGTNIVVKENDNTVFKFEKGPVFTNLLLADEINRATPKTQSALLEAMGEKTVTVGKKTYEMPKPFMVLATQNPIEQEGTYPLPEAQLDRFLMKILVGYNTYEEELEIVNRVVVKGFESIKQVAKKEDILALRDDLKNIHVDEEIKKYMVKLIFATRNPSEYRLDELSEYIEFGASPRASIDLYKASCALAMINGKDFVTPLDIAGVVKSVLRHRVMLNYKARAKNITPDSVIERIVETIKAP